MNQSLLLLVGIAAAPIILLTLLRTNAVSVFFSLCLGYVLMQFLGQDAVSLSQLIATHIDGNYVRLALLLLPPLLTSFFMIRTARGTKIALNVLPAIAIGGMLVFMVLPLLPASMSRSVTDLSVWHSLVRFQSLIIAAAAALCLLYKWMQRPKHSEESSKKHKG